MERWTGQCYGQNRQVPMLYEYKPRKHTGSTPYKTSTSKLLMPGPRIGFHNILAVGRGKNLAGLPGWCDM